jgi:hypothetical protein
VTAPWEHAVSVFCVGERCNICGADAKHKVGEELQHNSLRHNLTAYVCCACFGMIFGPLAQEWCGLSGDGPIESTSCGG